MALALLLLLPLLRVEEAAGRLRFLPSFYDSFRHALTAEMWFSDLWWLYASTSFGWYRSRLLVLWLVAVPVVLLLPTMRWRKTLCIGSGCLTLVVLEFVGGRLEFQLGDRSQSEWVWALRSRDPQLRRQAAEMLSSSFFKFDIPPGTHSIMRKALRDDVVEVRRYAARFLVQHPSKELFQELIAALKDDEYKVRQAAAELLAEIGPEGKGLVPALIDLLENDPDGSVRSNAAYALGRIGAPEATPALEQAREDPEYRVREAAKSALRRMVRREVIR